MLPVEHYVTLFRETDFTVWVWNSLKFCVIVATIQLVITSAAILIVTNTWNIVMGIFDMAQSVVTQAAGIINSDASIDISSVMTDLEPRLMEMDLGPLFGLWFQSLFIGITSSSIRWKRFLHSSGGISNRF